ncbi:hypothetical protein MMC13_004241 [Lambiella insularis]|nr:hypothetical protein [Lambiella insularis]
MEAQGNSTATPGIPTATAISYASGLAGVNMPVDDISSNTLYTSIAFLFLVILVIRVLQKGSAHLRHLMSMGGSSQQQIYWSQERSPTWAWLKQNLLYAPLRHKRHNREVQLSKAYNMGTIPSRLHTVILLSYFVSNLAYCLLLDYTTDSKAAIVAEIRGRTGHLSAINMVILFIFAGRNNPLITLLGVSFDTFNLFHRWIGRVVILEAVAHTIAWGVNEHAAKGWDGINEAFQKSPFMQYGLVGTVAMLVILLQAPSVVRHAFYETFLHLHQVLALLALIGVFQHAKLGALPQTPFIAFIIFLWCYDRLARLARLLYRNFSFRKGVSKVTVEALPGEACRVTFYLPRPWSYNPGMHAYLYLPSISLHMSHPFSIAWSDTNSSLPTGSSEEKLPVTSSDFSLPSQPVTSISFICAKRTGMTAKLYQRALECPSRKLQITGLLEGPYGAPHSMPSYGTILLFAGGAGITHQIGHVRALLAAYHIGTTAARRITLVWTVRTDEQLNWIKPWMDEILAMPGRREALNILLFVTKPTGNQEYTSASERVKKFPGRPKPAWLVEEQWRKRVGAMVVGVCGPGALADDVRGAVRSLPQGGVVDFWEEAFTW